MRSFKKYNEKEGKTASELAKSLAQAWSGKSSGDMLREILKEAEKSKRAGTLSNEEIDAFFTQFSPMLSPLERRKLEEVVKRLKEID